MGLVVNDLTGEEWAALKDAWNGCAYCGATDGPLQRDCVLAISEAGDTRWITSCRRARPAIRASAMKRSPRGCAGSGSTSAHS